MPVIGYCGIITTALIDRQDCVIDTEFDHTAAHLLTTFRGNDKIQRSTEIRWAPGVDPQDQNILGGLCATAVEFVARRDVVRLKIICRAIAMLLRSNFFYVIGTQQGAGMRTAIERLKVATPDQAREAIDSLPEVRLMTLHRSFMDALNSLNPH